MKGAAFFVTGTDTEVGKTFSSVRLMHGLRAHGLQVLGMKPVASGALVDGEGRYSEDARALAEAASSVQPMSWVNPYLFGPPISPHLAAHEAGVEIDLALLADHLQQLRQQADVVLVEGAGGWLAPLTDTLFMRDLALQLQLPVVLVVGMRLGCLNHALLSVESIRASGAPLLGWVANQLDPVMRHAEANLATLRQHIPAPCLGVLPWQAPPASPLQLQPLLQALLQD
ncbi:dethiobiotin synthase [Leeia aquatica]|uniref:ATP-dependent dethiobiotin synthetase BioD n=1 Tax=Leeia aquatica TaxID=2725557 RepID=A0A847S7Y2_9NEIS|nr:dethiobiotin synthase [Leeia aquatica]NLR74975.1 dethiobiotin synthase [Leeia aquatica]